MQKLSFRDQMIILVVLVIAIAVAGFMLLIKPKIEEIKTTDAEITTAQAEWDELEKQIAQIDSIKERIQKKYNESVQLGQLFVDVKRAYTLEKFIKDYIDKNGIYINTSASFSEASIVELTPYSLEAESLEYSIGASANLNDVSAEGEEENADTAEETVENQSLPCGTLTIDYIATRAGLMQFMQDIKESGKTIEIKSISIAEGTYSSALDAQLSGDITIDVYYADMISDLDIGAEIEAAQ
ncbi:MAG: hypothetical protein NC320_06615 [Clostridium sp.]|nr:hypothetical protein [Clostridium sp.]MCM1547082.1 hypothetical protein [Ruminococcus sp.]